MRVNWQDLWSYAPPKWEWIYHEAPEAIRFFDIVTMAQMDCGYFVELNDLFVAYRHSGSLDSIDGRRRFRDHITNRRKSFRAFEVLIGTPIWRPYGVRFRDLAAPSGSSRFLVYEANPIRHEGECPTWFAIVYPNGLIRRCRSPYCNRFMRDIPKSASVFGDFTVTKQLDPRPLTRERTIQKIKYVVGEYCQQFQ